MKAIILAAGVGQRLGKISGDKPKCLLEFDGITLLRRHLDILEYYGITGIIIVTGYRADLVKREVDKSRPAKWTNLVYNPDFTKGSCISMQTGLKALQADGDFLLMDADVLYDHRIIGRLIHAWQHDCFLLDQDFEPGDEPVKLCVRGGQLIEFSKKINGDLKFDFLGESVGFFRFSQDTAGKLLQSAQNYLDRGEDMLPYEECIRDLLLADPERFSFEDITGLHWIEIDFPEDVGKAANNVLPEIMQVNQP